MSHRASSYSPTPAPARTPSLGYLSNSPSADSSTSSTALWGNYDTGAALQYGVVASGNSAGSRGRTPSMSAAASLTASEYCARLMSVYLSTWWSFHVGYTNLSLFKDSHNRSAPRVMRKFRNSKCTKVYLNLPRIYLTLSFGQLY
jgi:hypothetical protein